MDKRKAGRRRASSGEDRSEEGRADYFSLGEWEGPVAAAAARELRGLALRRGRGGVGWGGEGASERAEGRAQWKTRRSPRPLRARTGSELSPKPGQLCTATPLNSSLQPGAPRRSPIARRSSPLACRSPATPSS